MYLKGLHLWMKLLWRLFSRIIGTIFVLFLQLMFVCIVLPVIILLFDFLFFLVLARVCICTTWSIGLFMCVSVQGLGEFVCLYYQVFLCIYFVAWNVHPLNDVIYCFVWSRAFSASVFYSFSIFLMISCNYYVVLYRYYKTLFLQIYLFPFESNVLGADL